MASYPLPTGTSGGDTLIQFSAPVNPGNSGGALCDAKGRIIGVVTFKLEQREGIAFAIPFGGIKLDTFIKPEDRKGDETMVRKHLEQASRFETAATMALFNGRGNEQEQLAGAAVFARLALIEQPCNLEALRRLSGLCQRLAENDLARAYTSRGLDLEPGDPVFTNRLGLIELQAGNKDAAETVFRQSLAKPRSNIGISVSSMTKLAEILSEKPEPDWSAIAYLCSWARELGKEADVNESPLLTKLRDTSLAKADEDVAAMLCRPKDDYSREQLEQLGKMDLKLPEQVRIVRSLFSSEARKAWATEALELGAKGAESDNGQQGTVPLPDHFTRAIPAMGGSKVVLVFEKLNKIAVFDMASGKISRFITPPKTNMAVAAGGTRLVLVDRDEMTWIAHDLSDKTKGHKTWSRKGGKWKLSDVTMSPYRGDLAWFLFSQEGGGVGVVLCALNEDEPFQRMPIPVGNHQLMRFLQEGGEADVSASGMTVLGRRGRSSSTHVLRLDTRLARISYQSKGDARGFRASVHPSMLLTNRAIYDFPDWNRVWHAPSADPGIFPIFGSESFIHARQMRSKRSNGSKDLHIRVLDLPKPDMKSEPLVVALDLAPKSSELIRKLPFVLHAAVGSSKIAVFDNASKVVRVVVADGILNAGSDSGKFAYPGKVFKRTLELPDIESAELADAPEGMTFDLEQRTLVWDVPDDLSPGSFVEVLLLLSLPGEKQEYITEKVEIHRPE